MATAQEVIELIDSLWTRNGSDRISDEDLRTVGYKIVELSGANEVTSLGIEWSDAVTYQTDELATSNNRIWKSKTDNNLNNEPPTDPNTTENTNWIEQSKSDSTPIQEWAAGVYGSGLIIVFWNNKLYKLNNPSRPFNSVNIDNEIIAGDWILISGCNNEIGDPENFDSNIVLNTSRPFMDFSVTGNISITFNSEIKGNIYFGRLNGFNGSHTFYVTSGTLVVDGQVTEFVNGNAPDPGNYDLWVSYDGIRFRTFLKKVSDIVTYKSHKMDGLVDSYITLPINVGVDEFFRFRSGTTNAAFSIAGYFKKPTSLETFAIYSNTNYDGSIVQNSFSHLLQYNQTTDKLDFIIYGWSGSLVNMRVNSDVLSLTSDKWYFFAICHDGAENMTSAKIYLGDVSGGTVTDMTDDATITGSVVAGIPDKPQIGRNDYSAYGAAVPKGKILDDFTFWSKLLSSAEVSELFNSGTGIDATTHSAAANLEAYYKLEGNSTDDSGNSRDGTDNNTPQWSDDYAISL